MVTGMSSIRERFMDISVVHTRLLDFFFRSTIRELKKKMKILIHCHRRVFMNFSNAIEKIPYGPGFEGIKGPISFRIL